MSVKCIACYTSILNPEDPQITKHSCRVITLVGMGGVGKTTLASKFVQDEISSHSSLVEAGFQGIFWRSLRDAPPAIDLIAELLQFTVPSSNALTANTLEQQIFHLLAHLRNQRYLIVLDDWECLLQVGKFAGYCTQQQEDYSRFLKRFAIEQHQSCLLLLTREQPIEIAALGGEGTSISLLKLKGLQLADAKAVFTARGFSSEESALSELIQIHRGNPAALKLVATTIQEVFNGNISQFLAQTSLMLGDVLQQVLEQQFDRLSEVEQSMMFWFGLTSQAMSFVALKAVATETKSELLPALESLRRRSLLDKVLTQSASEEALFMLEPVVAKYVNQRFVCYISQDLYNIIQTRSIAQLGLVKSHELIRRQLGSETQIHHSQRLLQRIQDELNTALGGDLEQVRTSLEDVLIWLQSQNSQSIGYAETNVRKLLELSNPQHQQTHDCSG